MKRRLRYRLLLVAFLVASAAVPLTISGTVLAASAPSLEAGDLDPSFGDGGIVATEAGTAVDVAIQPDGKRVVAGSNGGGIQAIRYNEDGSLDPAFGGDGIISHFIGDLSLANGVALQADAKIVLAGYAYFGLKTVFTLLRYDQNGVLDASFGDGGVVQTRYSDHDYARGVAIQPDGRILVAGNSGPHFALLRYLTDGSLDPAFGDGGVVVTDFEGYAGAQDLSLSPDGRIVVGGGRGGPGGAEFALARYHADGALDLSFGGDGIVTTQVSPSFGHTGSAVTLQEDGRVVLVGSTHGGTSYEIAVLRYGVDGQLDTAFGGDGIVLTSIGDPHLSDHGYDVVIQPDGRILVVGDRDTGASDIALVRYESDGALDTSFGEGGVVTTDIESSDDGYAVALQSDGRVVVAGEAPPFVAVLRYFGETPIASTLSLSAEPSQIDLGEASDLSGNLSFADGAPADGMTIRLTRAKAGSITELPDVTTDADGDFITADTPPSIGLYAYTATFVSDGTHDSASAEDLVQVGTLPPADFNADGLSDLAVGVPWEDVGLAEDTGALNVLYATDAGLASTGNQFWDQAGTGSGTNEFADGFGFSSATGDFNGDGFADLAAGAPGKTVSGSDFAGAVSVLYGGPGGLTSSDSQQWTQDSADVEEAANLEDYFGWSVSAGDFDGDGFADLVIGVPGENSGGKSFAGAVNVLYGSVSGLTAAGDQLWHQDSTNINNKAEASDQFGLALGTGDFNGDGFTDLAVGVPTENLTGGVDGGAVNVIYGSATGLTSVGDDFWTQDSDGINGKVEDDDWFGYRVAGGDFDGNGFDDLLVTAPAEDLAGGANAGAAHVIYGTALGLDDPGDDQWTQDSDGINDTAEANDEFGISAAAGDFDGDGYDDAAIGVPAENLTGAVDGGGVAVIYGTSGGLDDPNDDFWKQNTSGIEDSPEANDLFGYSVMAANFGNGPEDDLAIGVVLESIGSIDFAGAVNVIYGSPLDLTSTGDQFWSQDSTDILDQAEFDDEFGFGLAQRGGGGASGARAQERTQIQSPAMWMRS